MDAYCKISVPAFSEPNSPFDMCVFIYGSLWSKFYPSFDWDFGG